MTRREYPETPRVGVGAIVIHNNMVLLVKRGIEPSKGLWAIPGGMLKLGETIKGAAEREIREETGVEIKAEDPVYAFDFIERDEKGVIRFHYVVVDVVATYIAGEPLGADDALEARWFGSDELEEGLVSANTLKALEFLNFYLRKNI